MKFFNKFYILVNFVQEPFYRKDFKNIKEYVNLIILLRVGLNNYLTKNLKTSFFLKGFNFLIKIGGK